MLVVDDNGKWRTEGISKEMAERVLLKPNAPVVVVLGTSLPSRTAGKFSDKGWTDLESRTDNIAVVLSASLLRHSRAHIRRRLSWEQSVEDLLIETRKFDELSAIVERATVVVRFGMSAAVVLQKHPKSSFLVFDPNIRPESQRNIQHDGNILGKSGMIASCILREFISNKDFNITPDSIKTGLAMIHRRFERGYLEDRKQGGTDVTIKKLLESPPGR